MGTLCRMQAQIYALPSFFGVFSYDLLMLSCWKADCKERLPFSDLVNAIELILTKVADCLDMNQFTLALNHATENKSDNMEENNSILDMMESSM